MLLKEFARNRNKVSIRRMDLLIHAPLLENYNSIWDGLSPPFFVLIDSAGRTGVVLLCCGISIRKSEVKDIEWKLSWN